jgi:hypothetical protein
MAASPAASAPYQLVVACDASHRAIIEDRWAAMMLTLLPRRVSCNPHRVHRCVRVVGSSPRWPEAFPQHGPGRKHDRKIELVPWQREIVDRHPQEFLRGLFCEYCERLGIRWTRSNPRNISVSHRDSVALLYSFVPAKG